MPLPADPKLQDDSSEANSADARAFAPTLGRTPCLEELGPDANIAFANMGDQPLALEFLQQVQQTNLQEDFSSRLDQPNYRQSDRLLVRRRGAIIGHVQVSTQTAWFGGERMPTALLRDLHVLPEFEPTGYEAKLLASAECCAVEEGAAVALVRTNRFNWFAQRGWTRLLGQGHTRANTRAVLSHLEAQEEAQRRLKRKQTLEVSTWRHFELETIRSLYDELAPAKWGTLQRSELWWQWLVGRKSHDQILLVRDSRRQSNEDSETEDFTSEEPASESFESEDFTNLNLPAETEPHLSNPSSHEVVGYAVVRDSCLVEIFTLPGYEAARSLLLKRACQDAIDHDHNFVSLHTSADEPLHELLVTAGGNWIRGALTPAGCWMAKLLDPSKWVEKLYPALHERARDAGISRPVEIDFTGARPESPASLNRFLLTRRSARLETVPPDEVHRPVVTWQEMQDLLLSNRRSSNQRPASAQPALEINDEAVVETLNALFPYRLFWQSPFESIRL